ncbi:MAG: cyclodehydratase [Mycobacterium sp.]
MLALDPHLPVLLRPDGAVQVGWDPARAVLVRPPEGLSASSLVGLLQSLPMDPSALLRLALLRGLRDPAALTGMLAGLQELGVLRESCSATSERALSIRVHGDGPLSVLLADGLRCSGARVSVSSHGNAAVSGADLVVLADALATDPRLLRELHTARVPHLPVRVRDGVGFVGPLVIPGVTSCLSCVDRHRTDRDAAWPALSAQLREVIGCADRPTVLATAALALGQVQRVIAGVRGAACAPPSALNTSWQIDISNDTMTARRWPRHPLCGCWRGHG